ncbi:MAG TPA: aminotransferase class V-fold PLP-dependent enzyme [Candidatus Dormibacteraeota bacterium]|nr:aminotransferase class V-fold PLP-dependent enzyme [Candidatus Dormibacteraeota bacterium]
MRTNPLELSAAQFRRLSERVTELAASYLEDMDSRPVSPTTNGEQSLSRFDTPPPEQGLGEAAFNDLQQVIDSSRVQNGRFFGYVLGSGEPVAATADLLASVLNQNVTAWRSGPAAVMIEKTVVNWLAQAIGCPGFCGYLTGGGSAANLMGLTIAREAITPSNEQGVSRSAVVYASEEIHMSIPKSIALLGIGRDNLRLVPTDSSLRLDVSALERQITRDKAAGMTPVAVVASAGTVNTGAIDPLAQIAEIAHRHGAWFHIDGAYGALAAIAERDKFNGLELADSISLDPHKWLYQPLDCGCLLYRSSAAAQKAFSHSGDYARALSADPIEGFAFFEESLELSRRFRALKIWLSVRYHGLAAFRESIRKDLAHARRLADAITAEPQLELMAFGELSAVCFRYRGRAGLSEDEWNRLNAAVLKQTVKRGRVYLSNATLAGKFCLRACIVNHRTKDSDVDAIIPEVLAAAKELAAPESAR